MMRFACVIVVAWATSVGAQEKKVEPKKAEPKKAEAKKANVFLDGAEAGPEYVVQGEYQGNVGSDAYGAQVVALGKNAFDVYFLKGGLPGAGWDQKTRTKVGAALAENGQVAPLAGKAFAGEITLGATPKLAGKTDAGAAFALTKVERKSPTLGAKPPEGAIVLFDGTNASEWKENRIDKGLLPVAASTKRSFKDFSLHIEFRTPFQPMARGQGRGNSGVYLHGRDEVQVLDSFGLEGKNNECGGFYGRRAPNVNMCLPPLAWQTYDIDIRTTPDDPKKAHATVRHNGVVIHENFAIGSAPGPINLQNHGNPVYYRNIWLVELK